MLSWKGLYFFNFTVAFIILFIKFIVWNKNFHTLIRDIVFHAPINKLVAQDEEVVQKVIIISTVRSGSSFLGDLLQSQLGSYYFFEPLHSMTKPSTLQPNEAVLGYIRDLLDCNFHPWENQMRNLANKTNFLSKNEAYSVASRNICPLNGSEQIDQCYDLVKASQVCSNSRLRVVKLVRLFLVGNAERLLKTINGTKLLYLVRDPRGTMKSRREGPIRKWCRNDTKFSRCSSPTHLCHSIDEEIQHSKYLDEKYADRFGMIRFEEMACDAFRMAKYLFRFLGYPNVSDETTAFLQKNTLNDFRKLKRGKKGKMYVYTTSRESSKIAFSWHKAKNLESIWEIENNCERLFETVYTKFSLNDSGQNCDCRGIVERNKLCYPNKKLVPAHLSEKKSSISYKPNQ